MTRATTLAALVGAAAVLFLLWARGPLKRLLARTPLQRIGNPGDIAYTVLFLLRDAPFVTGQVINVDGGRSIVP